MGSINTDRTHYRRGIITHVDNYEVESPFSIVLRLFRIDIQIITMSMELLLFEWGRKNWCSLGKGVGSPRHIRSASSSIAMCGVPTGGRLCSEPTTKCK